MQLLLDTGKVNPNDVAGYYNIKQRSTGEIVKKEYTYLQMCDIIKNPQIKEFLTGYYNKVINKQLSNFEITEWLIKNGVDVDAKDTEGFTEFHRAIISRQFGLAELLLSYKANIDLPNNYGNTLLYYCLAKEKDYEVSEWLLEHSADINASNNGKTLLQHAIFERDLDLAILLLEKYGADVNIIDGFGNSVLCYAIMQADNDNLEKDYQMVELLLNSGVDLNRVVVDSEGVCSTYLDLACETGNTKIVELLQSNKVGFYDTEHDLYNKNITNKTNDKSKIKGSSKFKIVDKSELNETIEDLDHNPEMMDWQCSNSDTTTSSNDISNDNSID